MNFSSRHLVARGALGFAPKSRILGRTISHYHIVEKLGGGGMGVVYKAEDIRLKRAVALKLLPPETKQTPAALERVRREAQAASALNHLNICTIHDIGEQDGQPFIAMEFIEGHTLKRCIEGKPLPLDQVLELGIEITDATGLQSYVMVDSVAASLDAPEITARFRGPAGNVIGLFPQS